MSTDNLARARAWVDAAWAEAMVLYPFLDEIKTKPRDLILQTFSDLLAAVVWAKGEADAQDARYYLLAQGFEVVARSAYNRLYAHAADVPPPVAP